MGKDQILSSLLTLSRADLQSIRAAADTLLGPGGAEALTPHETLLLDAIKANVGAFGLSPSRARLFKRYAPSMLAFIEEHASGVLTNKVKALAVLRFMCGLLIADLKNRDIKVTPATLLFNLSRMQLVFESAFPHYIANGLVNLAVKQAVRGVWKTEVK